MSMIEIIANYHEGILSGLRVTLELCTFAWSIGLILGSTLAWLGAKRSRWIGLITRAIAFLLSSVPILALLLWLHYPAQHLLGGLVVPPFYTAAFCLSLVNTFLVANSVANVLRRFPDDYLAVARVCGLSRLDSLARIQLPIVVRELVPPLLTIQVGILQASLFAGLISVEETFTKINEIVAHEQNLVEAWSVMALLFLLICLPLNGLAAMLAWRFRRGVSV